MFELEFLLVPVMGHMARDQFLGRDDTVLARQQIGPGTILALHAYCLTFLQMIRKIVIPQALRSSVLQLTNLLVATMLTTSLGSQVPLRPMELTGIVSYINTRSAGGVMAFAISAALYCATGLLIGAAGSWLDRKVRILR